MTFDMKTAIARWRAELGASGSLFEADLDELESHLHDHIDALGEVGIHGEQAFITAVEQLGESTALAAEFAKVNPLLAWRAALFWICLGFLFILGGYPLLELGIRAVVSGTAALHPGRTVTQLAVWFTALGAPVIVLTLVFRLARTMVFDPLPWARSRVFRVGLIVAASVLMLVAHLGLHSGFLTRLESRWGSEAYLADWLNAWRVSNTALYVLTVVVPIQLGIAAYRQRARALGGDRNAAPLFWLAIGLFVGSVRCELHNFVYGAAVTTGGFAKLGPSQMSALVWIATLACPCALFMTTYAYLRHHAPGPSQLLRARAPMLGLAVSGTLGIGAVFFAGALVRRADQLSDEVLFAASDGWIFSGILMSVLLPLVIGTMVLRLRSAARLIHAE